MNEKKIVEKEIDAIYKQKVINYFNKYFMDKDILDAILNVLKDGTLKLSGVYIEFCIICDCLDIIVDNENLSAEYKKIINDILLGVSEIKSDIENIITQIAEEMTA